MEPASPALAGRFFTTEPPGKPVKIGAKEKDPSAFIYSSSKKQMSHSGIVHDVFLTFCLRWKLLISFVKTYLAPIICLTGFPDSSADKESPWNAGDPGSILGLGGSPGEGIGYLPQYSGLPWWLKNPPAMQETWVWSLGWEDPLEEGMATHSCVLAWRILMDRGAWWLQTIVCKELDVTERPSTAQHICQTLGLWFWLR